MALLLAEAAKLTPNAFQANIVASVITTCELWQFLPVFPISQPALVYNRELSVAGAAAIAVGGTITESASTFTQVTSTLETIAGDVDVDQRLQSQYSTIIDQTQAQILLKAKGVRRTLETQIFTGSGTSPNLQGVNQLVSGGQTISSTGANGDAISFALLDAMIDQFLLIKAGNIAFICNGKLKSRILTLFRSTNYNGPWYQIPQVPKLGTSDDGATLPMLAVPTYRGIPIIQSDYIPDTEAKGASTTLTSLYLASMDTDAGLCLAMGKHQDSQQNIAGAGLFGVEQVGLVQNADAMRYRVKVYAATALKSDKALVRARELIGA
jgi:hypothetical protein